jgi:hypothetical protein
VALAKKNMVSWKHKEAAIRLLERDGKVNPNDLVKAARSAGHPCHGDFTWDIEDAAKERWRDQARAIIRRCKFEVLVEEITERVVRYVPTIDPDENTFISLPKMRGVTKVSSVLIAEIGMLHGLASRVHGIAIAKQGVVGGGVAAKLGVICNTLMDLKCELEG